MPDSTVVTERQGFLAAFRYRNYCYLWGSGLGVATAISMELVVMGWLVLELTDSPALVGLVAACRFAGTALAPFFGALADRFDRRRILIVARTAGIIYTLALAALCYYELLEVWHIIIVALCAGVIRAFDMTTSNVLAPDTVERHNLTSAVGMLIVGMSTTRMMGPLLGGHLFERIGADGCFAVMAAAYLFACLLLFPMRLVGKERPTYTESVWKSVIGGIHYIVNDRALFALIVLAAIANLFAFPCVFGIMPVFARDVLHVEASGLGQLIAAEGLGGLIGALVITALGRFRHKGWLLIGAMIVWPALLGIFASLRLFPISVALLVIVGIARGIAMVTIQLLLLMWSSEEVRGRVIGTRMFAVLPLLVGNILSGAGATFWGAATVIRINALSCVFTSILTVFWAPQLRRRQ